MELHASDDILVVHALHIIKVEMRAAMMPQSPIERAGGGVICRLGNESVAIKVSHISLIDRCSEPDFLFTVELDFGALDDDGISLGA